jgi:hypothetical protein
MKSNASQKKKVEDFSNFKLSNSKAIFGGLDSSTDTVGGSKDGDIDPPSTTTSTGPRRPE